MLTKDDKRFLIALATIMMNHLAWLISVGRRDMPANRRGANEDWSDHRTGTYVSFEEKTKALLK